MADQKRQQHYLECLLVAYVALDRAALKGWRRPRTTRAAQLAIRYVESVPQATPVRPDDVFESDWSIAEPLRARAASLTDEALALGVGSLMVWPRDTVLRRLGATPLPPSTKAGRLLEQAQAEARKRK